MSLDFGKPDNIVAFIKDTDGNWRKLGDVTSMSIEHDHVYNETTLSVNVFGSLFGPDLWEFHPKREEPVFTFNERTSTEKLCELLGFAHPSKRERLKEHLPKKVYVMGNDVTCQWKDGTKTTACLHDGDEFDLNKGIMICAIKKWMPGGSYWFDALDECNKSDTEVIDVLEERRKRAEQKAKEKEERRKRHEAEVARAKARKQRRHAPVNHDNPGRPYMRGGRYGDDEKMHVIELVESGMTQQEVSKITGISQATVSTWMKQWRENE